MCNDYRRSEVELKSADGPKVRRRRRRIKNPWSCHRDAGAWSNAREISRILEDEGTIPHVYSGGRRERRRIERYYAAEIDAALDRGGLSRLTKAADDKPGRQNGQNKF